MKDGCSLVHRPGLDPECECGRRAVLAAADAIPRPRRRFEVKITIGADTWEGALDSLHEIAVHVQEHGPTCSAVLGGSHAGYSVEVSEAPEMVHAKYFEALDEWRTRRSEAMDAEANRQRVASYLVSEFVRRETLCPHCTLPLRGDAVLVGPDGVVSFRCAACGRSREWTLPAEFPRPVAWQQTGAQREGEATDA